MSRRNRHVVTRTIEPENAYPPVSIGQEIREYDQCEVTDEFVSQEVVDELIAAHTKLENDRATARRESEAERERLHPIQMAAHLAELREKYPWAIQADAEPLDGKRAAKNLKKELQLTYPGVKFSVSVSKPDWSYSSEIRIKWESETPTSEDVRALTQKYDSYRFDGMNDYSYTDRSPFGCAVDEWLGRVSRISVEGGEFYAPSCEGSAELRADLGQLCDLARSRNREYLTPKIDPGSCRGEGTMVNNTELAEAKALIRALEQTALRNEGDRRFIESWKTYLARTGDDARIGLWRLQNLRTVAVSYGIGEGPDESVALSAQGFD